MIYCDELSKVRDEFREAYVPMVMASSYHSANPNPNKLLNSLKCGPVLRAKSPQ